MGATVSDRYITITLELSGYDEGLLLALHDELRQCLRAHAADISYGELHIAYQDQEQRGQDAHLEPAPESWEDEEEGWGA